MASGQESILDRVTEQLTHAFRSPRFSWEAAYFGSLVLFGMFALAGRFLDRPPENFIPARSAVSASVESRLDPLIQAGGAGMDEAERLVVSSARSAAETGKALWSAAEVRGRQFAGDASRYLSALQRQLGESAADFATWIEALWAQE